MSMRHTRLPMISNDSIWKTTTTKTTIENKKNDKKSLRHFSHKHTHNTNNHHYLNEENKVFYHYHTIIHILIWKKMMFLVQFFSLFYSLTLSLFLSLHLSIFRLWMEKIENMIRIFFLFLLDQLTDWMIGCLVCWLFGRIFLLFYSVHYWSLESIYYHYFHSIPLETHTCFSSWVRNENDHHQNHFI